MAGEQPKGSEGERATAGRLPVIFEVDPEAENEEQLKAFEVVGAQFMRFRQAMLNVGMNEKLADKCTAHYAGVVCDLLYLEHDCGERVDPDTHAG